MRSGRQYLPLATTPGVWKEESPDRDVHLGNEGDADCATRYAAALAEGWQWVPARWGHSDSLEPMRTRGGSHEGGNVIHRFVKHHRVLWVPAGWLSRVVASSQESSPVRSMLGPLRDRLRGAMKIDEVERVLSALESHDVPVCLAGGWGVDALLGRQTRSHDDLDIVIDDYEHQVKRAVEALAPLGFRLMRATSAERGCPGLPCSKTTPVGV